MIKYDYNYYYNLLKIQAQAAKQIVDIRYKFIQDNILNAERIPDLTILDYGCGVGFMKAFMPEWVYQIDTYDILPVPQTGITKVGYDIVLMYDVLEHIADFSDVYPILKKSKFIVVSVPIKPKELEWNKYKHFKIGEHLHYYDEDLLLHIFGYIGFEMIASGTPECPPREYINSYIFKKI